MSPCVPTCTYRLVDSGAGPSVLSTLPSPSPLSRHLVGSLSPGVVASACSPATWRQRAVEVALWGPTGRSSLGTLTECPSQEPRRQGHHPGEGGALVE